MFNESRLFSNKILEKQTWDSSITYNSQGAVLLGINGFNLSFRIIN